MYSHTHARALTPFFLLCASLRTVPFHLHSCQLITRDLGSYLVTRFCRLQMYSLLRLSFILFAFKTNKYLLYGTPLLFLLSSKNYATLYCTRCLGAVSSGTTTMGSALSLARFNFPRSKQALRLCDPYYQYEPQHLTFVSNITSTVT